MNKILGKVVGNTTATPMRVPDWLQKDSSKSDFIKNKPDVANVLKGSASGNPLVLTDVSPIEHEILVSDVADDVTITRMGKNLLGCAGNFRPSSGGVTLEYDNETQIFTLNGTPTTTNTITLNFSAYLASKPKLKVGSSYVLSLEHISGEYLNNGGDNVFYIGHASTSDGRAENWTNVGLAQSGKKTRIATASNNYLTGAWIYIGSPTGVSFTDYKFRVQLENGDTATEFTPFVEPVEYIGNHLDGIKIPSLYPTTVLYEPGGGEVRAEYNRDINKVIANLENAILTLGGNA